MRNMVLVLVAVMLSATAAAAADVGRPDGRYYQPRWGWPFDNYQRRGPPPAWCNTGNVTTGDVLDCSYYTFQQCVVSARGVGGSCTPNPVYEWARYNRGRPHGWRY
jgi:Protein of unknown function (DUF3551)